VVRVSGTRLDRLSALIGDLFTAYLRVRELFASLDELESDAQRMATSSRRLMERGGTGQGSESQPEWHFLKLRRELAEFRRNAMDRASIMATSLEQVLDQFSELRLLPVSSVFDVHKVAARNLARERGKRLAIAIEGEATLVDRSVLDALGDILLHLVRNAVDHGVEAPADREAQGKNPQGTLTFRASLSGDRLRVEVEDDGRGIDFQKIKLTAARQGLASEVELNAMEERDLLSFVFRPGFSTAEQTTEISGRGVGMDVVRTRLQELGGAVHLSSKPGRGTCAHVELPTSIAISRLLLFRCGKQVYSLLATFVDRVDRLDPKTLMDTSAGRAVVLEDRTVPVLDSHALLGLAPPARTPERLSTVIVEHGGKRVALLVDELLGERELTLKPLGPFLAGIRGVSGAAMMEDGTVVPVLRAGDLVGGLAKLWAAAPASPVRAPERLRRVLLVEDSLITREIERSLLGSLGLEVEEASDGQEALEKLRAAEFDLLVTDLEMPRLDGFALTRQVKSDSRFSRIPVIVVTTRGSAEDRRRGLEAGADAYLVKSDFKRSDFEELVRRFLP
jgi:two-component system chemotaxis sensor kinase CheA/two-component system sensor histidine kinase and response regulator WspE